MGRGDGVGATMDHMELERERGITITSASTHAERERITHFLVDHRDRAVAYPPALFELLADPRQAELLYRSPDGRFSVVALAAPWP